MPVDFARLKETVRIEQVLSLYNVPITSARGDQWRATCLSCDPRGKHELAVKISSQSFYCHLAHTGGDLIALAAYLTGLRQREAAEEVANKLGVDTAPTIPPAPGNGQHQFQEIRMLGSLRDRLLKLADSDHPEHFKAAEIVDDLIIKLHEIYKAN